MSEFRISRRVVLLRLTCAIAATLCAPDPLRAKDGGGGGGGGGGGDDGGGGSGRGEDGDGRGNSGRGGSDRDHDDDGEESGSSRRRGPGSDVVEVVYPGGWVERVEGGRLRMRDPRGRLVIDRRAVPADIDRLRRRAR